MTKKKQERIKRQKKKKREERESKNKDENNERQNKKQKEKDKKKENEKEENGFTYRWKIGEKELRTKIDYTLLSNKMEKNIKRVGVPKYKI